MNRLFVTIAFLCLPALTIVAQQITTVAVVDVQRVYTSFSRGNSLSAGIASIQRRYQEQIDAQLVGIERLQARKQALSSSERTQIRDIEGQILAARAEVDRLSRLQTQELRSQRQFTSPDTFIPELQRAVVFVAESRGYTVVFNAEDTGLQWWSPVVDITDDVIARLIVQISR